MSFQVDIKDASGWSAEVLTVSGFVQGGRRSGR
jgi:hypothetical protein